MLTFFNGGSLSVVSVTDDFRVHSLTEYSVSLCEERATDEVTLEKMSCPSGSALHVGGALHVGPYILFLKQAFPEGAWDLRAGQGEALAWTDQGGGQPLRSHTSVKHAPLPPGELLGVRGPQPLPITPPSEGLQQACTFSELLLLRLPLTSSIFSASKILAL